MFQGELMSWTDERVELLKKLWTEGLSASQIASRMGGVTRNAVIGKVHRLGLSGRATPTRAARPRPAGNSETPNLADNGTPAQGGFASAKACGRLPGGNRRSAGRAIFDIVCRQ